MFQPEEITEKKTIIVITVIIIIIIIIPPLPLAKTQPKGVDTCCRLPSLGQTPLGGIVSTLQTVGNSSPLLREVLQ